MKYDMGKQIELPSMYLLERTWWRICWLKSTLCLNYLCLRLFNKLAKEVSVLTTAISISYSLSELASEASEASWDGDETTAFPGSVSPSG